MTTTESSLQTSQEARTIAESRLATIRAETEAKALEQTLRLLESPQPVPVPWTDYPQYDEWIPPKGAERPYLWTNIEDRTEGKYLPLYETEHDLRRIRAESRRFKAFFPVAEGALGSLTDYVIGDGFQFTVQPEMDGGKDLVKQTQTVVDEFLAYNDFAGVMDREIHSESRVEGDTLLGLYPDAEEVRIELMPVDALLEPANKRQLEHYLGVGHKLNYWQHGVHTQFNHALRRDDCCRPLGYHFVFDDVGDQWDYLPSSRVEHIKRNVGKAARRGVGDFYIISSDLEHESRIRRNTAVGAATLAALVMIRQHAEGVPQSTVESMVARSATSSYTRATESGGRTAYVESVRPGTVKDIPAGMTAMLGPLGTLRSPVYIEVGQYVLRIIGLRWRSPEYMISGDASNANYASTLVAESPFVKAREDDQRFYGRHFERLIWKALRMYHGMGRFGKVTWEQLVRAVSLKTEYPAVSTRNKLEAAQVNGIMHQAGVMSKRTWCTDAGLDYDQEQEELAKEPQPLALPMGQPAAATDMRRPDAQPKAMPQPAPAPAAESMLASEELRLNGAQITAAVDVLKSLSARQLTFIAAVELLTAIGIPHERAEAIARASANNPISPAAVTSTGFGRESLAVRAIDRLLSENDGNPR